MKCCLDIDACGEYFYDCIAIIIMIILNGCDQHREMELDRALAELQRIHGSIQSTSTYLPPNYKPRLLQRCVILFEWGPLVIQYFEAQHVQSSSFFKDHFSSILLENQRWPQNVLHATIQIFVKGKSQAAKPLSTILSM
jgi:hypothetical protein